jgi:hypothetical protein
VIGWLITTAGYIQMLAGPVMFDVISGILLGLILLMMVITVYVFRNSSSDLPDFFKILEKNTETMAMRLDTINDVLCDLADIAESAPVTTTQMLSNQNPPQSIGELITTVLLNRATDALGHAATRSEREIHPKDYEETQEQYESDGSSSKNEI